MCGGVVNSAVVKMKSVEKSFSERKERTVSGRYCEIKAFFCVFIFLKSEQFDYVYMLMGKVGELRTPDS